jgi:eukaryotic-like serine/threonine-protein kinase
VKSGGPEPTLPLPDPYEFLDLIGCGASGLVYRTRNRETGEQVALKLLHGLQPEDHEGFRREIHALSSLRHPGVVRVLDSGVAEGRRWYAMDLVPGAALTEAWRSGSWTLDDSLRAILSLCETLAYIHGEGLVHRDLKPSNVIVSDSRLAILIDFGLASRFAGDTARDTLEVGGWIEGTVDYMAPEQVRAEYVDARADLYSLGCILYQAIAGRPPFSGSARAILRKHLEVVPHPLSSLVRQCPPALEALTISLLAKDPRDRLGYADDAAAALASVLGIKRKTPAQGVRQYLYRPRWTGDRLHGIAEKSVARVVEEGTQASLLISGPSGSGKTRLAMEVFRFVSAHDFEVIAGECIAINPGASGAQARAAPLHAFAPLLRFIALRCMQDDSQVPRAVFEESARALAAYEPSLAELPSSRRSPAPSQLSGDAERERAIGAICSALQALGRERRILIAIDDLQWADDLTLAAFKALAGSAAHSSILLLGTIRSEEAPEIFEWLSSTAGLNVVTMSPMDSRAILSMVSDMLAMPSPPEEFIRMLSEHSEGNPYFVCEYVRTAVELGLLRRGEGAWQAEGMVRPIYGQPLDVGLPRNIHSLLRTRLQGLELLERSVLDVAAVLGREFEADLLEVLCREDTSDFLTALTQLLYRGILEDRGGGTLRFSHDKLREVSYDGISNERLVRLHEAVAREIERRAEGPALPQYYSRLAHDWLRAGKMTRATRYLELAAEHALERGSYGDAYRSLKLLLTCASRDPSDPLKRARALRMLSLSALGVGNLAECRTYGEEALAELGMRVPGSSKRWAASAAAGFVRRALPKALAIGRASNSTTRSRAHEIAMVSEQLASAYFFGGAPLWTAGSLIRGLEFAEAAGQTGAVVDACARLGFMAGAVRLMPVARHYLHRARREARLGENPRARALALYLEGMHWIGRAGWSRTQSLSDRAARILRRLGDVQETEVAMTIGAHGHFYAGDDERALDLLQGVLATATERGNAQHRGWGKFLTARSLVLRGRSHEAFELSKEADALLAAMPDTLSNIMLDGTLALSALYSGRVDFALTRCRALLSRIRRGDLPATGQCIDGVAAVPDVLLTLLEESERSDAALLADVQLAISTLRRFSLAFAIARPAMYRSQARYLHALGQRREARRSWTRSLRAARTLGMPLEAARVHLDMTRHAISPEVAENERRSAMQLLEGPGWQGYGELVLG